MPGRDGTGPLGAGSMTGRGLGICAGVNAARYGVGVGRGLGLACRHGSWLWPRIWLELAGRKGHLAKSPRSY